MLSEITKFRTFEARGIESVRLELERGTFNPEWRAAAVKWIGKKGLEAERRAQATQAEQSTIARSAARATWVGVVAAALAAVVSLVGAAISLVAAAHH